MEDCLARLRLFMSRGQHVLHMSIYSIPATLQINLTRVGIIVL